MKDEQIVGAALAEVLPKTDRYWFQQPHLLRLNLLLLIPLLSSSVAGYDGKCNKILNPSPRCTQQLLISHLHVTCRLFDERPPVPPTMARILWTSGRRKAGSCERSTIYRIRPSSTYRGIPGRSLWQEASSLVWHHPHHCRHNNSVHLDQSTDVHHLTADCWLRRHVCRSSESHAHC